jgi:hypothetical protein
MLERGEVLLTWRLSLEPVDRSSLPIPAERIFDHRRAFLDFEGRLSGDQGTVRRVDLGTAELEEVTETRVVVKLSGRRLNGRFTLVGEGDDWTFNEASQDLQ